MLFNIKLFKRSKNQDKNVNKECEKYKFSRFLPLNKKEKCKNKYAFKDEFGRQ